MPTKSSMLISKLKESKKKGPSEWNHRGGHLSECCSHPFFLSRRVFRITIQQAAIEPSRVQFPVSARCSVQIGPCSNFTFEEIFSTESRGFFFSREKSCSGGRNTHVCLAFKGKIHMLILQYWKRNTNVHLALENKIHVFLLLTIEGKARKKVHHVLQLSSVFQNSNEP